MAHNIGNTIAELRKKKKWTQTELAQKLNISDKAVSKWENDGGLPSVEFFPRLADLFGVSIDYLMTGKEDSAHEEEEEEELSDSEYGVDEQFRHDVDELCVEELALIVQDQADLYGDEELRYIKHRLRWLKQTEGPSKTAGSFVPQYDVTQLQEQEKKKSSEATKESASKGAGEEEVGCFAYGVAILFPIIGMIWGVTRCRDGAGKKMLIAAIAAHVIGTVIMGIWNLTGLMSMM